MHILNKQHRIQFDHWALGKRYLHLREFGNDLGQLIVERLLQELDFARVEGSNSADSIMTMDHGRSLPLCLRENHLFEVLKQRDHKYIRKPSKIADLC